MNPTFVRSMAIVLSLLMVSTGIVVLIPSSSASEPEYKAEYGAHYSLTYDEIDEFVKSLVGKSIEELVDEFNKQVKEYHIDLSTDMESEFAIMRDTTIEGNEMVVHDHYSAYVKLFLLITVDGKFPDAGTYYKEEGEDFFDFMDRVFIEYAKTDRTVNLDTIIGLFADVNLYSHIDMETGEITHIDVSVKIMMDEDTNGNFQFTYENDENLEEYVTIGYENKKTGGNFYLDPELDLDFTGFKMLNDELIWELDTTGVLHIDQLIVSSDLADTIWGSLIAAIGPEADFNKNLPELILSILKSSNRMVDLLQTLRSLASMNMQNVDILAKMSAHPIVDEKLHGYVEFTIPREGGEMTAFKLSTGAYTLDFSDILLLIPSYILPDERRIAIEIALALIGLDKIDVEDLSADPVTKAKCENVFEIVDEAIFYDEDAPFIMPQDYAIIAGIGIVISILTLVAIRRRLI